MKIFFNEWSCSNIDEGDKQKIEDDIRNVIRSNKNEMKFIPEILTISIFEDPLRPILIGSGTAENGAELVKFMRPQITGEHSYDFIK